MHLFSLTDRIFYSLRKNLQKLMSRIINPFVDEFEQEEKVIIFLYERKMLPIIMNCPKCSEIMELTPNSRNQCGRVWRCRRPCRKSVKFLQNNFF